VQVYCTELFAGGSTRGDDIQTMCDQCAGLCYRTCHHSVPVCIPGVSSCVAKSAWHCHSCRTTLVHALPHLCSAW